MLKSGLLLAPMLLEETGVVGNADVSGMLTTSFTSVAGDMMSTITAVVPIALGIVGAVMAIRFGVKFFRGLAK